MTPEEGMRAHLDLQGGPSAGLMLPIHWATFNLATHAWADPGEGTVAAARAVGARVGLPRPGEPFEPTAESVPSEPWWRGVARTPAGGWPTAGLRTDPTAVPAVVAEPEGEGEGSGEPEAVPAG
jgi:hypothetical protein